ncbi:MAG: EF-hand domain-containing protein, partial [Candidatus Thermoplasmatota archaeon]|nr:EF-hand domain-containing protein [Candidatus Thermoplasmatota archaeon]
MTRLDVLIASLLLIVASLSGCITEELVDDILGCMDENAANYEENATTELVGDCIYMATAETFMEAMTDVGSIEDILEDTPKAGYSQSISSSEWNQDLGMQMDVEIEDIVMADLNTDSVYVHNSISIAGLLQIEYTHVQVGEVVNIHLLMGGMMAQGDATQSVSQTRDATPNVLEVIAEQAGLFTGEDDDGEDDDGPVVSDGIPEDAVITIAMSDDMESQTMTMEYTEDGAEITTTIHIDQNQDLVSMSVESDNGSATSSLTYEVMWGDAIVIEVDDTLPRTSIPVWFDSEIFDDVNDHDDHGDDDSEEMFPCDGGNTWIPWDWVNDGYEDCEDGSDEYDDDGSDSDNEPEMWMCDNGDEIPEDWVNDGYEDCEDGSDEYDDDGDDDYAFYCSNDGEDYAESMGGILCPEGPGVTPECPNGESCVCIDVDGSCNDGDDDWGYYADDGDGHDDHDDHGDDDNHDDDGHHDDGNHISWDSYYDGYCEWEGYSDATDAGEDSRWWCKISQDDEEWENWWYYCEHHDSDWHCTDDFGQSEEFEHSADNDEWSASEDGEDEHDGHDDDDGPPSPESVMYMADSDGDGNMSQEEFVTYWNNENPDAPIDSDQSFLTTEDVEDLIELCDYDAPSDLIDITEMQCFIDNLVGMMPGDENTPSLDDFFNHFDTDGDGHLTATEFIDANDIPDDEQDDVHAMFDMYDNDESGGLDYYEFEPLYDMMVDNDDGEDGDDDGDGMERNDATGFVAENQTLNAPITDFEVHFLSDCEEEY